MPWHNINALISIFFFFFFVKTINFLSKSMLDYQRGSNTRRYARVQLISTTVVKDYLLAPFALVQALELTRVFDVSVQQMLLAVAVTHARNKHPPVKVEVQFIKRAKSLNFVHAKLELENKNKWIKSSNSSTSYFSCLKIVSYIGHAKQITNSGTDFMYCLKIHNLRD